MKKRISDQQIAFIQFELTNGDAKARKTALQNLAALCRHGGVVAGDKIADLEKHIVSLLLVISQDKKVVRWGLNALAQCGRWTTCQRYVELTIKEFAGDPEIEAAGVAALCKMLAGHTRDIGSLAMLDPRIWKLAALQTADPNRIDLTDLKIDINNDSNDILKLALIAIGVNRDVEHLFDPRHTNGTFVCELCSHDDAIVQQYSVWAVTENHRLSLQNLGLRFDGIDGLRPNVQSKMYHLAAQRVPDLRQRIELIGQGAYVDNWEVREGLSKGVQHSYFEGLESVLLPWFEQETVPAIRGNLAEHIAAYSDECGPYLDTALESFEVNIELRDRIMLGAEGTPLYGQLRSHRDHPDLFSTIGDTEHLSELIRASGRKKAVPKKTVCMLLASPRGETPLRLDEEVRDTLQKLKLVQTPTVEVEIRPEWAVKLSEITDHLLNSRADIVHFSGHGNGGAIFVEDVDGRAIALSAEALAGLIAAVGSIECIVLNACYTDEIGRVAKDHVRVVIGCNDSIADAAAITFTRSFYRSLAHGRDYEASFQIAKADVLAQNGPPEAEKYRIRA